MKKYRLNAIINNEFISFDEEYKSTTEALNAGFDYILDNVNEDVYVEDEFKNEATNNIEYILSNHDRIIISHA